MYELDDKLAVRGVESLSDCELLSLLLDEGDDGEKLSERVLTTFSGSLSAIVKENVSRLRMVDGLGLKRAKRLILAAEFGRRVSIAESNELVVISNSSDVARIFRPKLEALKHEECWVLYLNASNRVVEQTRVSQGGITATVVDHRLIVKRALELLATHIVVVHNHPSGSVEPSAEDVTLTKKIKSAAALFDIDLLDHIIIAPRAADFSFLGAGIL